MADFIPKKRVKNSIVFSDFDLNMRRHPVTGKLIVKKNEDSIKQALKYLVLTNKRERFFNPLIGTDLRKKLFENIDPFLEEDLRYSIETAIKNFEPRVSFQGAQDFLEPLGVFVTADPENNLLRVTIRFTCIETMKVETVNINLDRIR